MKSKSNNKSNCKQFCNLEATSQIYKSVYFISVYTTKKLPKADRVLYVDQKTLNSLHKLQEEKEFNIFCFGGNSGNQEYIDKKCKSLEEIKKYYNI